MEPEGSPLLEGWLEKKGEKGLVKLYLRRWFEVRKCGDELRACYFASVGGNELGFIPLNKITDIQGSEESPTDFTVTVPGRVYYLRAEDENEKKSWMRGLDMKSVSSLADEKDEKKGERFRSHGTVLLTSFQDHRLNDGKQAYLDVVSNTSDNTDTNSATSYYGKKSKSADGGYGVLIDQVYYGSHGGSPQPKQKKKSSSPIPKMKKKSSSSKKSKKENEKKEEEELA